MFELERATAALRLSEGLGFDLLWHVGYTEPGQDQGIQCIV